MDTLLNLMNYPDHREKEEANDVFKDSFQDSLQKFEISPMKNAITLSSAHVEFKPLRLSTSFDENGNVDHSKLNTVILEILFGAEEEIR